MDGPLYVDEHLLVHDAANGRDYYYLLRENFSVERAVSSFMEAKLDHLVVQLYQCAEKECKRKVR